MWFIGWWGSTACWDSGRGASRVPDPEVTLPIKVLGVVTGGCCPSSHVIGNDTVVMDQNHTCSVGMVGFFR